MLDPNDAVGELTDGHQASSHAFPRLPLRGRSVRANRGAQTAFRGRSDKAPETLPQVTYVPRR